MSTAPDAAALGEKAGGLNKVETKTGGAVDAEAVAAWVKKYDEAGGDAAKAANPLKLKDGASFKDATDFANQLLAGTCLAE